MSNDIKNILSNSNKDIDNQQLMDYLSQQLSDTDHHAIEKSMADDTFMDDAIEGLQNFENKNVIPSYVEQLNNDLKKQLAKKKLRREKRTLKDQPYIYFAIILILLIIITCFIVFKSINMNH